MWRRLLLLGMVLIVAVGCNKGTLTISPSSGPCYTEAILSFKNLQPYSPIAITQSSAVGTSIAVADTDGNADVVEIIIGEPGEVVTVTAEVGTTGYEYTLKTTFTIVE